MRKVADIWIDVGKYGSSPDLEQVAPMDLTPGYEWQALFACQIVVRPFADLMLLKWGFNAAVLLQEAMDRQRLFIEAQHPGDGAILLDWQRKRSLALRCQHHPAWNGLLLSLIGKVSAETKEAAQSAAYLHWSETRSIFPYDYELLPAADPQDYRRLTGWDILHQAGSVASLVQVRRYEQSVHSGNELLPVNGFWQSAERSDEQVWRTLAGCPVPVLLNITVRPEIILDAERKALLAVEQSAHKIAQDSTMPQLAPYAYWAAKLAQRRGSIWSRSFAAQVSLASSNLLPEYIPRTIGTAITRSANSETLPGYQAVWPCNNNEALLWASHLYWLELLPASQVFPSGWARLQDMIDHAEAQALFRFPYPPEPGLPGVKFLSSLGEITS